MIQNQTVKIGKSQMPLKCGVVGFGYLGQFHAEKYAQLPNVNLVAICDTDAERLVEAKQRFDVATFSDHQQLLHQVDAVSIVVPTAQHYAIAKDFLMRGIHVLLEKPMTRRVAEADALIHIAQQEKVHLQIGHLERFNPTIQLLMNQQTQRPYHISCQRLAPFNTRGSDVNVILDLMIHDLDLILQLIQYPIENIKVNGNALITKHIDIAHAWINFEKGYSAHLYANRASEQTKRQLRFYYENKYMVADLKHKTLQQYKTQGNNPQLMCTPLPVAPADALYQQLSAFIKAITYQQPVTVNGQAGRRALAIALQLTDMIQNKMATCQFSDDSVSFSTFD